MRRCKRQTSEWEKLNVEYGRYRLLDIIVEVIPSSLQSVRPSANNYPMIHIPDSTSQIMIKNIVVFYPSSQESGRDFFLLKTS